MKSFIISKYSTFKTGLILLCVLGVLNTGFGQNDSTAAEAQTEQPQKVVSKPVKNTFENIWILDNQTVMVPIKGTFQLDFMHRWGTWDAGYQGLYGLFTDINMRFGFNYVPKDKLLLGLSFTQYRLTWEGYAKYALLKQTQDGKIPVSVTYYGDVSYDTKSDPNGSLYPHGSDRFMFFNQIIIARKINEKFSVEVAPSITHVNSVMGYYTGDTTADGKSIIGKEMHHDHFAIAFSGKMKLSNTLNLLLNYDQPLTVHFTNNPAPNISAGLEINTSAHTFQVIIGNYFYITPSRNNYYNHTDPTGANGIPGGNQFRIGFNLTRLWNF
jgi:hypothetical protein